MGESIVIEDGNPNCKHVRMVRQLKENGVASKCLDCPRVVRWRPREEK